MPAPVTREGVSLIMDLMGRARGRDTNDTVLRHPITTLLLGLVFAGLMGAITVYCVIVPDETRHHPVVCDNGQMSHPEWVVFLAFTFPLGILVGCFYYPVRDEYPVRYALYGVAGSTILAALSGWVPTVGFPLLGLVCTAGGALLIWDYFKERHQIEPDGLRYRTFSAGSGILRWSEVVQVHYKQYPRWFRLVTRQGKIVRVSAMLIGLPAFARAVLAGVPDTSIGKDTRQVLEQTAVGILPPLPGGGH